MKGIEGLLAGHTLAGRYRIEEVIGRGGFAAVYRARDETLQRTVAVKVIMVSSPDPESRRRLRARFHREARAAARLQHPHVVTVYDFGTDPELGLDFLVMELLRGQDLAARSLGPEPITPSLAMRIWREAVEGVAAGHRAGLIHRDVKPGNLFLAEPEDGGGFRIKVLDFGIAQIVTGDETITQLTHGGHPLSPAYASPEQLRGERPLSPASDVYSLGVIAWEMLSGERMFGRGDDAPTRRSAAPLRERNPEVPAAVAEVVSRAMTEDPAQRYPDAGVLARALEEALHDPAPTPEAERRVLPPVYRARTRARLPEEPASPVRPAGRTSRRGAVALLAVLVLAGLGGVGWWAMADGGDAPVAAGRTPANAAEPGSDSPAGDADAPPPPDLDEAGGLDPVGVAGSPPVVSERGPAADADPRSEGWSRNARALYLEGMRSFEQGDFDGAVRRFRDASRLEPGNASFRNDLAWALFRAGALDQAGEELETVIRTDPARAIAHANLGEVRLAQSDTAAAIAAYRRFLELNDDPRRESIAREKLERIGG